jgi:hypothetical protein
VNLRDLSGACFSADGHKLWIALANSIVQLDLHTVRSLRDLCLDRVASGADLEKNKAILPKEVIT